MRNLFSNSSLLLESLASRTFRLLLSLDKMGLDSLAFAGVAELRLFEAVLVAARGLTGGAVSRREHDFAALALLVALETLLLTAIARRDLRLDRLAIVVIRSALDLLHSVGSDVVARSVLRVTEMLVGLEDLCGDRLLMDGLLGAALVIAAIRAALVDAVAVVRVALLVGLGVLVGVLDDTSLEALVHFFFTLLAHSLLALDVLTDLKVH
jgi:hypothetical protein